MQHAQVAALVLVVTSGCRTAEVRFEDPVPGGLLVRVVDAEGHPVPGAEVRAPSLFADPERELADPDRLVELLYAGSVGRTERFGLAWRTDANGEARIAAVPPAACVAASSGTLWGATSDTASDSRELVITIRPDETQRVVCADREGRPGTGALVWVGVDRKGAEPAAWGAFVTAADGSIEVPHAQHWRALQKAGEDVRVAGFVLWGDELMSDDVSRSFPTTPVERLDFTVSPTGWIDVRADASVHGEALLRWLDAPVDPDEPDDVPENPLALHGDAPHAVPLGLRLELHVGVPGRIDPRIAFDGPKKPGERVEVAIGASQPAARVTGRLVDADGNPMPRRAFDAWLERDAVRVAPEEDWLVTDDEGRFAFDFAPGGTGTLRVRVDTDVSLDEGLSVRLVLGAQPRELPPPITARHEFATPLPAGEVALGDLVCGREP